MLSPRDGESKDSSDGVVRSLLEVRSAEIEDGSTHPGCYADARTATQPPRRRKTCSPIPRSSVEVCSTDESEGKLFVIFGCGANGVPEVWVGGHTMRTGAWGRWGMPF